MCMCVYTCTYDSTCTLDRREHCCNACNSALRLGVSFSTVTNSFTSSRIRCPLALMRYPRPSGSPLIHSSSRANCSACRASEQRIHIYICVYVYIYIYIYMYIYIYVHIHIYIYIHVYVYIHIHIYIYINMCIHTPGSHYSDIRAAGPIALPAEQAHSTYRYIHICIYIYAYMHIILYLSVSRRTHLSTSLNSSAYTHRLSLHFLRLHTHARSLSLCLINTHTHTRTHAHTHIHKHSHELQRTHTCRASEERRSGANKASPPWISSTSASTYSDSARLRAAPLLRFCSTGH